MTTRQAMVAAKDACGTLWQRARGSERGVIVRGLKKGEVILLDYTLDKQLQLPVVMETNGRFPFPLCDQFRLRKEVDSVPLGETYVEIEVA